MFYQMLMRETEKKTEKENFAEEGWKRHRKAASKTSWGGGGFATCLEYIVSKDNTGMSQSPI